MDAIALLPLEVAGCGVARALSEHPRSSGLSRRPRRDPVFDSEPLDPLELLCVAGDERRVDRERVDCDPYVEPSDRRSMRGESRASRRNEPLHVRKTSPMRPFQMDCARSSATTRNASRHST